MYADIFTSANAPIMVSASLSLPQADEKQLEKAVEALQIWRREREDFKNNPEVQRGSKGQKSKCVLTRRKAYIVTEVVFNTQPRMQKQLARLRSQLPPLPPGTCSVLLLLVHFFFLRSPCGLFGGDDPFFVAFCFSPSPLVPVLASSSSSPCAIPCCVSLGY